MVSGGGRGLGAAIARRLAEEGWTVSVGVRRPSTVSAALSDLGDRVSVHRFDAREAATAGAWTQETVDRHGRLDALINNAGILKMVDFETGSEADLDELWEVNFKAAWRLVRAALPHLKRAGNGRVINVASTDGKRYRDTTASLGYVVSKHALVAMSHAIRFAGWEDGVRATAVCPGAVDTEMIAGVPGVMPKGRRLQPETVAGIVSTVLNLPPEASVAEFVVNTRLESTL